MLFKDSMRSFGADGMMELKLNKIASLPFTVSCFVHKVSLKLDIS